MTLERWTISATPTPKDPERHTLWVKADAGDLAAIIRGCGGECGRPRKELHHPEFNFSLSFPGLTQEKRLRLETQLRSLGPSGSRSEPAASLGGVSEAAPEAARAPAADVPPAEPPKAPAPVPAEIPAAPAVPKKAAIEEPPKPSVKKEAPPPPAVSAKESFADQALLRLDPGLIFETLVVGPFNRFAHAASMAVVANPGTMYNPLFLYGVPGTGKSHMLTAIAAQIEANHPGEKVFFTTGPRLSREARAAAAAGQADAFAVRMRQFKALMIDDAHLLAVGEDIQPCLASVMRHFFDSSKHVGMTSVYPPRALGALEEALKFQIGLGWSVEMKIPNVETQKVIVQAALMRAGFQPQGQEEQMFFGGLENRFFELHRWLERLRSLARVRSAAGGAPALAELISTLFAPFSGPETAMTEAEVRELAASLGFTAPPPMSPGGKTLTLFFPKGTEETARFVIRQFIDSARQGGLQMPIGGVQSEPYDPNELFGGPFQLADRCDRLGAQCVLIVGPNPGTGLSGREGEFQHALEHLLTGSGVWMGWIPFVRLRDGIAYQRAVLDTVAAWGK